MKKIKMATMNVIENHQSGIISAMMKPRAIMNKAGNSVEIISSHRLLKAHLNHFVIVFI